MEQKNTLLIECVLKIDDWGEFYGLMINGKYQAVSAKNYDLADND